MQTSHLTLLNVQLNKLRDRLDAIAKEIESSTLDTYLDSLAKQRAAEAAAPPVKQAAPDFLAAAPRTDQHKPESHYRLKAKDKKPKKPLEPKIDELEEAEKRPKLFEPAAGSPPKIGEEELAAEGSGHEVLLQVWTLPFLYVLHAAHVIDHVFLGPAFL